MISLLASETEQALREVISLGDRRMSWALRGYAGREAEYEETNRLFPALSLCRLVNTIAGSLIRRLSEG